MDLLPASSSAALVNQLRVLIATVKQSTSRNEKNRSLRQVLEVLRALRDRAPQISRHVNKELQELIVEIEPVLSTAGLVAGVIGAGVAVVGLFMQGLCEDESNRRIGSRLERFGGAVAVGSFEIVSMIEEVVAELKPALQHSSTLPALQSSSDSKLHSSEAWNTGAPLSTPHRKSLVRQSGW